MLARGNLISVYSIGVERPQSEVLYPRLLAWGSKALILDKSRKGGIVVVPTELTNSGVDILDCVKDRAGYKWTNGSVPWSMMP